MYFSRIGDEYLFLQANFHGIQFDLTSITNILLAISLSLLILLLFFSFGHILRSNFLPFTHTLPEKHFISIALGYTAICTAISLLGMFSLLTPLALSIFLMIILVIVALQQKKILSQIMRLPKWIMTCIHNFHSFFLIKLGVLAFLMLTFLRLIPPEIGADAMDYHTSFSKLYLFYQTLMIPPFGTESYITVPQLSEIPYLLALFFNNIDASRFIHFSFYVLTIFLVLSFSLWQKQIPHKYYALLLVTTTPLVLRITSSAYSDFQTIFCFFLALSLLIRQSIPNRKIIILSGIIFGSALASKLWTLAFFPALVGYLFFKGVQQKESIRALTEKILLFVGCAVMIAVPWYIRSSLLSGNLFYHTQIVSGVIQPSDTATMIAHSFDWREKFMKISIADYSPFFFIGLLGLFPLSFAKLKQVMITHRFAQFFAIFAFIYLFLPSEFYDNRYLLSYYLLASIVVSVGLVRIAQYPLGRAGLIILVSIFWAYSALTTFLRLPYALGWADRDAHLARVMLRPSAYYDFNHEFSYALGKQEIIATYGLNQFYYAPFIQKHVYHIAPKGEFSLNRLPENNITKLLIRGGDIHWFCKELAINNCNENLVTPLSSYKPAELYLYQINKP